ncbi:alpha/beta hydrolase [Pseudomonas syringae pv. actinidiae]|nr:alpha/beta hydrolase [Pseudomonas syringae pv. actinidiae]
MTVERRMHSAGKMLVFCNVFVISLIVHALYADASSWAKVIPLLQAKGLHVTAVQIPTTSLEADVDAVKRTLALQDGPTLLVAHSYGGMVISQAGDDPKVKGLVYVAARAPDAGEDYPALTRKFLRPLPGLACSGRLTAMAYCPSRHLCMTSPETSRCRKPACISPFSSQSANLSPWQRPPWRLGTTSRPGTRRCSIVPAKSPKLEFSRHENPDHRRRSENCVPGNRYR